MVIDTQTCVCVHLVKQIRKGKERKQRREKKEKQKVRKRKIFLRPQRSLWLKLQVASDVALLPASPDQQQNAQSTTLSHNVSHPFSLSLHFFPFSLHPFTVSIFFPLSDKYKNKRFYFY